MSHSHTHAPGEEHSHSHSHAPQQQQQSIQLPPPDPALQALIDQDFAPVPLALSDDNNRAMCSAHKLEKCGSCDIDFTQLNHLSALLVANPQLQCPPPANTVVTQKITQVTNTIRNDGNAQFKSGHYAAAIKRYTAAAEMALSRPPWEANHLLRDELSTAISNRSATYCESHDYISALADAEAVIQMRRQWSKGHFRKAKALLGLNEYKEAAEAVKLGLSFEPANAELSAFLAEIETFDKSLRQEKEPRPITRRAGTD